MQKTTEKIKTFLPVFSGFYNTIWDFNDDDVLYNINQSRMENNLLPIEWNNMDIDYKTYENDVAKSFCEVLQNLLSDYIENITFENIYSPKTYNFSTDSINCIIEPKTDNIKKFIYNHKKAFCVYLKNNHTSCDGFISHYSNNFSDWEGTTENFTNFEYDGHILGSILQFIYNELNFDSVDDICYSVMENIYEDGYINNIDNCYNTPICEDCKKFIDNEDILKDIKKYYDIMEKYPSNIKCFECMENI